MVDANGLARLAKHGVGRSLDTHWIQISTATYGYVRVKRKYFEQGLIEMGKLIVWRFQNILYHIRELRGIWAKTWKKPPLILLIKLFVFFCSLWPLAYSVIIM
jgi:hypothetical protein